MEITWNHEITTEITDFEILYALHKVADPCTWLNVAILFLQFIFIIVKQYFKQQMLQ